MMAKPQNNSNGAFYWLTLNQSTAKVVWSMDLKSAIFAHTTERFES